MSERKARTRRIGQNLVAAAAILLPLTAMPASAASWDRAHADGVNDGFIDVATAPAGAGSLSIPQIGTFAPGAGPVTGADGTVYIGNEQGTLFAFHADGSPAWHRDLPTGQAIKASPVVAADGSIFVVSVARVGSLTTDHRTNPPTVVDTRRYESTLHHFIPGGGYLGPTPFPEQYGTFPGFTSRGVAAAPPNIVKSGDIEALVVPVVYNAPGGHEVRLLAFATSSGAVLDDVRVTYVADTITGEFDACDIPIVACFHPGIATPPPEDALPANATIPFPGAATYQNPQGGHPWVLVSDRNHDLVGFTFSPDGELTERFRAHDDAHVLASPPVVLPDGHTAVGTEDGEIIFAGPNGIALSPVTGLRPIYAAPTRTADGRVIAVERGETGGGFAELRGDQVLHLNALPGQSIASAAASRTHVYIATASAFYSYDAATMGQVMEFPWHGGGLWPPVIGPQGHVYAMASNILFVFPPPPTCIACGLPLSPVSRQ